MRFHSDLVRLLRTSTPLRNVEQNKERQVALGWGKSATLSRVCKSISHFLTSEKCKTKWRTTKTSRLGEKCQEVWHHPDFALLDYSTLPPLLLPRLPLGSLRSQIFFSPTPFFSPFSSNAEPGPRLLGFRLVILQNRSKFFCYNLLASSSHSQCPPYLIYTFQGRREEVKKYRCAFPLLSKLLSFRYIFEKRHTLNSLLTDTSIRQTPAVGSCRSFVIFLYLYSLRTHAL